MIGWAFCASFCTTDKAIEQLRRMKEKENFDILPIYSENFRQNDTRFGKAADKIEIIESICEKKGISSIVDAEPLGPKIVLDALVIAPCTGNTLAKLANAISDTTVTMAAKAHMRNSRPLVIALSSNDLLLANLKNIAALTARKNVYFVPMCQDDFENKPYSMSCDFDLIKDTLDLALKGKQIQPMLK